MNNEKKEAKFRLNYENAKKLVIEQQTCTTSFLCRELGFGSKLAKEIVAKLETEKVIGEFKGNAPREVIEKDYTAPSEFVINADTGRLAPQTPDNPGGGGTKQKKGKKDEVITRKENFDYEHYFTTAEKGDLADTMSQLHTEIAQLEQKKKAVVSDYNSQIELKEAELTRVSNLVKDKFEMRPATGIVVRDFGTGEKYHFLKEGDKKPVKTTKLQQSDFTLHFPQEGKKAEEKKEGDVNPDEKKGEQSEKTANS